MVQPNPDLRADASAAEEGEGGGIDLERIKELGGFVLSAARRRRKLVGTVFVTVAGLGLAVAATMPRTYETKVKLLAQRSAVIAMTSPNRDAMREIEDPTKNVAAMILRRDNLVALAKDADLPRRFAETRPAALRFKDRVTTKLFGPMSDEDKLQAMVMTLESKLDVETDEPTSTVTITVDWAEPHIAYDLVMLVQKNFFEARYDAAVAVVNDSIAVLEAHAKEELSHVDDALEEYQKLLAAHAVRVAQEKAQEKQAAAAAAAVVRVPVGLLPRPTTTSNVAAPAPLPDVDLAKALEETRRRIRSLEETQQRTVDGLRAQLLQAQLTLTPMHPQVIALQQQIDAASQPSPELAELRGQERALMAQIAPPPAPRPPSAPSAPTAAPLGLGLGLGASAQSVLGGPAAGTGAAGATAEDGGTSATQAPLPTPISALDRDGPLQLAQSRLGTAIRGYEDAMNRVDSTRVELDILRAAYKHKYTVVTPPEVPRKPKKATAQAIGAGSVFGGALLGIVLAALLDFLAGVIRESWQVRRSLKVEVLGELDAPP